MFVWFSENTPPNASFTGSMQLLAGVKLSTDRPITNHPHYENKFLRERTKQVRNRLRSLSFGKWILCKLQLIDYEKPLIFSGIIERAKRAGDMRWFNTSTMKCLVQMVAQCFVQGLESFGHCVQGLYGFWRVLELQSIIFSTGKSLKMVGGPGKSWKSLNSSNN